MDKVLLSNLLDTNSPSGREQEIVTIIKDYFNEIADVSSDTLGNVYAAKEVSGALKVMLIAHCDEIGFQVADIDENGFIAIRNLGGFDKPMIPGSQVTILNEKKHVLGIVSKLPIHVIFSEKEQKIIDYNDIWIDIGVCSKEEALSHVSIGDYIALRSNFQYMDNNNRIVSKALDNKVGVFVMMEAFAKLSELNLPISLVAVASTQEELGCRGCVIATEKVKPDIAIVLDVGIATDIPHKVNPQFGNLMLGRGPGININPSNNARLTDILRDVAIKNNIPHQMTIGYHAVKGTENSQVQLVGTGVASALISIPIRNMHTPCEICDMSDIQNSIDLLIKAVCSLTNHNVSDFDLF